ncbi:MAG TPA: thermonuclease family protein [Burkholderiales bacterium]|nr:thermonuclease family protein [Burkholderiales bacterium]
MAIRWLFLLLACVIAPTALARCVAVDGDSLVCDQKKIRLSNVYAAELKEPGGQAAKKKLQELIKGRDVVIVPRGTDKYGRTLAEVYVDGRRIEQSDIGPRAGRGSGARYHVRKSL